MIIILANIFVSTGWLVLISHSNFFKLFILARGLFKFLIEDRIAIWWCWKVSCWLHWLAIPAIRALMASWRFIICCRDLHYRYRLYGVLIWSYLGRWFLLIDTVLLFRLIVASDAVMMNFPDRIVKTLIFVFYGCSHLYKGRSTVKSLSYSLNWYRWFVISLNSIISGRFWILLVNWDIWRVLNHI